MRIQTPIRGTRPGKVRGSGQWILFGLALGVAVALSTHSNTKWIARTQLTAGLIGDIGRQSAVYQMEGEVYEPVDSRTLADAERVTANAGNDLPLMMAGRLFTTIARSPEFAKSIPANGEVKTAYYDADGTPVRTVRLSSLKGIFEQYPARPLADAAYLDQLIQSSSTSDRESFWLGGGDHPGGSQSTKNLDEIERAARTGSECDPNNAFFYMMLAYVHFNKYQDTAALRDIENAAHASYYSDYAADLSGGWQRLNAGVCGGADVSADYWRYGFGQFYHSSSSIRAASRIAIWKAVELEHRGNIAAGIALRMRIASVGALQCRYRPDGYANGTSQNLIILSASGYGGRYHPKLSHLAGGKTVTDETAYEFSARLTTAYELYLAKHGYNAAAAWYTPLAKGQIKQANIEVFNARNTDSVAGLADMFRPAIFTAAGLWILGEITFVGLAALALAAIGFRRRFVPRTEVYWNRAQWGSVFAGVLISIFCLISCSILYTEDNVWPLLGVVGMAIAGIQVVVRRPNFAGSPITMLLNALCASAAIFIAAAVSIVGLHNYADPDVQRQAHGGASLLGSIVPYALTLLPLPALILFGVAVIKRTRYQGVPGGLFYGARAAALPLVTVLLAVWSVAVVINAGVVREVNAQICEELNISSDVLVLN